MKKLLCALLALALMLGAAPLALAESYLFGYVIGLSPTGFELINDRDAWFTFTTDEGSAVDAKVIEDDAVLVRYEGTINDNAQAQAVKVLSVSVLQTFFGKIERADADTILISSQEDESALYLFSQEQADIVTLEDGIKVGNEVEIAYQGELVPSADQVQNLGYTHIAVFDKIDEEYE